MPLPILAAMALGALGGSVASKGTKATREYLNRGETTHACCHHCGHEDDHAFSHIDRGMAAGVVLGAAGGAIAGTAGGILARRVFTCSRCEEPMYEDGSEPGWNADRAIWYGVYYRNVERKTAKKLRRLQELLAKHKVQASRHAGRISQLEQSVQELLNKLERTRRENEQLREAVNELLEILEREQGAA